MFPPELLRLNYVGVKSFLMEMYVPQLINIICKSIFLPLESTGGYQRVSFSTRKFITGFIIQRLCFCSMVLCVHLRIQKFKDQKSFLSLGLFFFLIYTIFLKVRFKLLTFILENNSYNIRIDLGRIKIENKIIM